MRHLAHMFVLASILSVFFAFLFAGRGRRLQLGLKIFAGLAGGALLLGYVMYPFS